MLCCFDMLMELVFITQLLLAKSALANNNRPFLLTYVFFLVITLAA
jgi:hypothetical protein